MSAAIGYVYGHYSSVVPCEVLKQEVASQVLEADVSALSSLSQMLMRNDDQVWCAKEFSKLIMKKIP